MSDEKPEPVEKKLGYHKVIVQDLGKYNTQVLFKVLGREFTLPKVKETIENYLHDAKILLDIIASTKEDLTVKYGFGCNPMGISIILDIVFLLDLAEYYGEENHACKPFEQCKQTVLDLYWSEHGR